MQGDKLASGAASATFPGPRLKFDQAEMQQDLHRLPAQAFRDKYMVTTTEYELMIRSDVNVANAFARSMEDHLEVINRLTQKDERQEESLKRECFIKPFFPNGDSGRIIVSRDQPAKKPAKIYLPRDMRKQRELLPSTGRVLRALVVDAAGNDVSQQYIGQRIVFGGMSGTALCFSGYPTWITLDVGEILGLVEKEDVQIIEQELEPLV
jgi:hypothetical protein